MKKAYTESASVQWICSPRLWKWFVMMNFRTCRTWYKEGVGASVELALKTGYRLIDCAFVYLNEGEVGDTLQKCFKNGVAKREDTFITSKLW